jgi:hypothetical protein
MWLQHNKHLAQHSPAWTPSRHTLSAQSHAAGLCYTDNIAHLCYKDKHINAYLGAPLGQTVYHSAKRLSPVHVKVTCHYVAHTLGFGHPGLRPPPGVSWWSWHQQHAQSPAAPSRWPAAVQQQQQHTREPWAPLINHKEPRNKDTDLTKYSSDTLPHSITCTHRASVAKGLTLLPGYTPTVQMYSPIQVLEGLKLLLAGAKSGSGLPPCAHLVHHALPLDTVLACTVTAQHHTRQQQYTRVIHRNLHSQGTCMPHRHCVTGSLARTPCAAQCPCAGQRFHALLPTAVLVAGALHTAVALCHTAPGYVTAGCTA